jgi:RNA polymerase sigma-70 factor (ECF subfamily)
VELNRAVAVAMESGAAAGLEIVEALQGLEGYLPYWAAKAQMLLWTGANDAAAKAYARAVDLARSAGEASQERFLRGRLAAIETQ